MFGYDTVRTFPEWWGAAGNGAADDAPAIQAAFDAAAASSAAMLYLSGKTYGLGREVTFTNGANVMSEPSARFVAGEAPWRAALPPTCAWSVCLGACQAVACAHAPPSSHP